MTKNEFLLSLQGRLSGLPEDDVEERLNFYGEMIEDRMEEGLSEGEAVSEIGSVCEIAAQIIEEFPLSKIAKKKMKPKNRWKVWEIVLLALGSPIWLSLLIAAFAVVLSLYISLWAVIISFWAAFVSVAGGSIGGIATGVGFACSGNVLTGIAIMGVGIVCAGFAVFLFYGCKEATKGTLILPKKLVLGIKKCFINKERAK